MDRTGLVVAAARPRLDRLFLHFFDTHFLAERSPRAEAAIFDELRRATRLAVASAEKVYIPAASYFESEACRRILGELPDLIRSGIIELLGSSANLDEFVRERVDESFYKRGSTQNDAYRKGRRQKLILPYSIRKRSATRDIVEHWGNRVVSGDLSRLLSDAANKPIATLESRLERVPVELGKLAFIPEHVYQILDVRPSERLLQSRLRDVINEGYFGSYVRDLKAGVVVDLSQLGSGANIPSSGANLSYSKMERHLRVAGIRDEFDTCDEHRLLQFRDASSWGVALQTAVSYPAGVRQQLVEFEDAAENRPRVVLCITAAAIEFKAVHIVLERTLGNARTVRLKNDQYALQIFRDSQRNVDWALVQLSFQGQVSAAVTVTSLRYEINPDIVLMVGMCMGMPRRKLAPGTVIVPNEVVSFEHQRHTKSGPIFRPHGRPADNVAFRVAAIQASVRHWGFQVICDKGLASASVKVEDVDASLVKAIESQYPDAVAYDMEGSGFYAAGERFNPLWVKAVADSGEPQGSDASSRDGKQRVQESVTHNAVEFAHRVVCEFFDADVYAKRM